MPELPEVETMVRGVRPQIEGRIVVATRRVPCRYRPILIDPAPRVMCRRAVGLAVTSVCRIAKRVVFRLSSGDAFVIEPRMTGLMLIADPPDVSHLRFQWQFSGGVHLWFWDRRGLGTIRLIAADDLETRLGPTKLGPDPLTMSPDDWSDRLSLTARPIKVALLDQTLVAGIGNLYACEILHAARIAPGLPANRLDRSQLRRLHRAALQVLETAIAYEGSTLGDGTYRNALNRDGSYQNEHRVYARAGTICPSCRSEAIQRIVQAQRATFFCPRCQRV
jgi:formamidopyrimidine-DNA glycosylase